MSTDSNMAPIHPGEVLMLEYLQPLEVTQHRLAVAIGAPPRRINEIVHGKRRVTPDTALRLARLKGAIRGKKRRTTIPDGQSERAPDLVDRDFKASAPNRLWVSDFTYVAAWSAGRVRDSEMGRLVDWYNNERLHGACERLPPVEFERMRRTQINQ
jgi:addiction module HigA family antidote